MRYSILFQERTWYSNKYQFYLQLTTHDKPTTKFNDLKSWNKKDLFMLKRF